MNKDELRIFRKHLREIEREVGRNLKVQTICCGVTPAQCHVILEVGDMGHPSIVELADRLKLDASTLSRTVDGLVRNGFLDRRENPENRRSTVLSLTDQGQKMQNSINRACDDFYLRFLAKIPETRHKALLEAVALLSNIFAEIGFQGYDPTAPCTPPK